MTAAIAVGILVAAGVYLILQRGLVRIAVGFVLLGHAANIVLIAAGGMALRDPPLVGRGDTAGMADPLPQAFVLTAIVITFGITVFLLALARAGGEDEPPPGEAAGADPGSDPGSDPGPDPEAGAAAGEESEPGDGANPADADRQRGREGGTR